MGSEAGATGLLAMGAAGLAVGFAVGTEFLLGAGELGLGVGTLGKLGMGRAPRTRGCPNFCVNGVKGH